MGCISRNQLVAKFVVLNVTVATAEGKGFISVYVSKVWVAIVARIGFISRSVLTPHAVASRTEAQSNAFLNRIFFLPF